MALHTEKDEQIYGFLRPLSPEWATHNRKSGFESRPGYWQSREYGRNRAEQAGGGPLESRVKTVPQTVPQIRERPPTLGSASWLALARNQVKMGVWAPYGAGHRCH